MITGVTCTNPRAVCENRERSLGTLSIPPQSSYADDQL